MSAADAARILAQGLEAASRNPDESEILAALTTELGAIEIASGRLRLAWKPKDGLVRFHFAGPEGYDERMAKEMRSSKDSPEKLTAREDVIRRFRGE
ncbi:MAG: hypothetical protein ACKVXR_02440 [Planctomycetota bacterium]